jgi:hypothetical protein
VQGDGGGRGGFPEEGVVHGVLHVLFLALDLGVDVSVDRCIDLFLGELVAFQVSFYGVDQSPFWWGLTVSCLTLILRWEKAYHRSI